MMQPYFQDEQTTIYLGDCREVLPTLPDASADLVLTDPPYAEETHAGARGGASTKHNKASMAKIRKIIDFDAFTIDQQRSCFDAIGRVARAWVVATMDWRHICEFEREPPDYLRFVRFGVWVKPNGTPQFTGDRPGTGWEGVIHLHREGGRMVWSGGGRTAVYSHCIDTSSIYPSAKPLSLVAELIRLFSKPGDLIVDPFMGSGVVLRAAKNLGRRAIGIDVREQACDIAARRLAQEVFAF